MLNGNRSRRQNAVPATMAQNQGIPVKTWITSRDHRTRPAGVHEIKLRSARSPYCKGGKASGATTFDSTLSTGDDDETRGLTSVVLSTKPSVSDHTGSDEDEDEDTLAAGVSSMCEVCERIEDDMEGGLLDDGVTE